jgi:hypothetical protein
MNYRNFRLFHAALLAATAVPTCTVSAANLDMDSRWQIRDYYNVVYPYGAEFTMDWTGNYAGGDSGSVSEDWLEATRVRVNFFRAMGGIDDNVVFDPALNAACQDSALMMSANNALSHFPPNNWQWWTQDGYDAANNGNIAIGSVGPDAMDGFMADAGGNNTVVGHRRWILFPQTTVMGSGDVPGNPEQFLNSANTLWVIQQPIGPRPEPRDDFIAWPPPGHVPASLVWPRWSLHYPNANFTGATVTMESGGQDIPFVIDHAGSGTSFPENAIVWVPNNMDTNTRDSWPTPDADETIDVTVSNVIVNSQSRSFTYSVTIFDPSEAGPGEFATTLTSPGEVNAGSPANFTVATRAWSEGAQIRSFSAEAYTEVHGAENGQNPFNMAISEGFSPIQSGRVASGSSAFHLVNPDGSAQLLTLPDEFTINAGSPSLSFDSSLAWASETQFASVDVNLGSGNNWQSIWSQFGPASNNNSFTTVDLDLSAYVGSTARFRFRYDRSGGSYFFNTEPSVGWAFDNVTLSGVGRVSNITEHPATFGSSTVPVNFAEPGSFKLQARDIAFDGFFLDWGPITDVTVSEGGSGLTPDTWNLTDIGWVYGHTPEWGFSLFMGFVYMADLPYVYQIDFGWFFLANATPVSGGTSFWFHNQSLGWVFAIDSYGGFFQAEFNDPAWSYDNFLNPNP